MQNLAFEWDLAGNLAERETRDSNGVPTTTDVFSYDALDRLTNVKRNQSSILGLTYDSLHLGNIQTKSDLAGTYAYGQNGAGPHAVTSIGAMTFGYDANGNMTSRNGAPITWTSYNLPSSIQHASGDAVAFQYGPDRSRYVKVITEGGVQKTLHYAGPEFEVLTSGAGSRTDTHYIYANGEAIAQYTTSNVESDALTYLHRDHEGSVVAVSDTNGTLIDTIEYDAFGARAYGSQDLSARGYTGHEQLDAVEMIHMNGRVQDPVLGRFVSADPFVQAPYFSQSLNRYSYAWNNPMSLVDPSGYQTEEIVVTGQRPDPYDWSMEYVLWMLGQYNQSSATVGGYDGGYGVGGGVLEITIRCGVGTCPRDNPPRRPARRKRAARWTPADDLALFASEAAYVVDCAPSFARRGIRYSESFGFKACLLEENGTAFLAFAGTNDLVDWIANGGNSTGFSTPQLRQALVLARNVIRARGESNVIFTGHSLGGALASYVASQTEGVAITFNAAGVHPLLLNRSAREIRAHYIVGDQLSLLQDFSILPNALGQRIPHMPKLDFGILAPFDLHSLRHFVK